MIHREMEDFANLYLRGIRLAQTGDIHEGHQHYFDHVSLLTRGAVEIEWRDDDGTTGCDAYDAAEGDVPIRLPASRWHRIRATQPNTRWWCLFALRDAAGNVVDRPEDADQATHRYMSERP